MAHHNTNISGIGDGCGSSGVMQYEAFNVLAAAVSGLIVSMRA
jgi:hypothetical protein